MLPFTSRSDNNPLPDHAVRPPKVGEAPRRNEEPPHLTRTPGLAAVADSAHALATYGEHPLIRSGIEALGLDCVSVEVNGNYRSSKELIIARDLEWLQPAQLSLFGLMD